MCWCTMFFSFLFMKLQLDQLSWQTTWPVLGVPLAVPAFWVSQFHRNHDGIMTESWCNHCIVFSIYIYIHILTVRFEKLMKLCTSNWKRRGNKSYNSALIFARKLCLRPQKLPELPRPGLGLNVFQEFPRAAPCWPLFQGQAIEGSSVMFLIIWFKAWPDSPKCVCRVDSTKKYCLLRRIWTWFVFHSSLSLSSFLLCKHQCWVVEWRPAVYPHPQWHCQILLGVVNIMTQLAQHDWDLLMKNNASKFGHQPQSL